MREGIKRTPVELLRAAIEEQKCEMPCGTLHELHGDEQNICNDRDCIECMLDALRKAADLVEAELDALKARALPEGTEWLLDVWPRFEDNEPVKLGDMALIDGEADMVEAVQLWIHGKPVIYGDGGSQQLERGERVKRPAPKVLDADGVEIRVGDTVWVVGDAWPSMQVLEINPDDNPDVPEHLVWCGEMCSEPLNDTKKWRIANELTHRAPVIAADGKPLKEGETVYVLGFGEPLTVKGFTDDGRVLMSFHDENSLGYKPSRITHERPDSWELLEEDAGKSACEYFAHMPCGCETSEMLDGTVENCNAAKARDLVRRARALAERDSR